MKDKLAVLGGIPVRNNPFPARKLIGEEEREAVNKLMDKCINEGGAFDRYAGSIVDDYEKQFAAYFGVKYASAVSSGTASVHTALGALRIEPFSEVISAPITDPGAVAPILWMNCIPVFADVEPDTYNMSASSVEEKITDKTAAIIACHIGGDPCDIDGIMKVAAKHKIPVIEDFSQSHDAVYKGRKAGTIGDLGVVSLMSGKLHTAGGQGGMVITNNEELYWNAKRFADRGKPFNSSEKTSLFLGINYRMTSLEAVIGMVQLKKLADIIKKRRAIADKLKDSIKGLKAIKFGKELPDAISSRWFMVFKVDEKMLNASTNDVVKAIGAENASGAGMKYDNLIYEQKWIKERSAYGSTQFPWSSSEYGKKIVYEGSCPNAKKTIESHFVIFPSENWGDREIEDLKNILCKVEEAYLK